MDPIKIGSHTTHPQKMPGCRFAGPLSQRVGSWLAITVGLPGRVWVAGTDILNHFKGMYKNVQDLVSCGFLSPIHPLIQLVMRFTWRFVAHPFWPGYIQQLRGVREGKAWESSHPPDIQHPYGMVPSMWFHPLHPPWFLWGVYSSMNGWWDYSWQSAAYDPWMIMNDPWCEGYHVDSL